MLENSYYSVISPEGCSSILWKSADHAAKAAAILKLTAKDLLRFRIVDDVVPEPPGGAHQSIMETCRSVEESLVKHVDSIAETPIAKLLEQRYEKIRRVGRTCSRSVSTLRFAIKPLAASNTSLPSSAPTRWSTWSAS